MDTSAGRKGVSGYCDSREGVNPGAILNMLKMAQLPQYRANDQIKSHILYVDYRMGRR